MQQRWRRFINKMTSQFFSCTFLVSSTLAIGSCTDFKSKWLTSGGFFSNYNSSECGGHVLEQNDNFIESDWLKKSTWPSMFTTIFILSAENRVDSSALWIDEIPNGVNQIYRMSCIFKAFSCPDKGLKGWSRCGVWGVNLAFVRSNMAHHHRFYVSITHRISFPVWIEKSFAP